MIGPAVRVRLVAFALLALLGTSFVAARYVGFGAGWFGSYRVSADFADSGGIFAGAQVTYRGVVVGQVSRLRLAPDGVYVDLLITGGPRIPADTLAVVADRSAVGEQYLDLQPRTSTGPWLHAGSLIPRADTRTPLATAILLRDLDRLLGSVDRTALVTTVDELDRAFAGTGPQLQRLLDAQTSLLAAAQANLPQTLELIGNARTVLATQAQQGSAIRSWAAGLAALSGTLRESDPDLRRLLGAGAAAGGQLTGLLTAIRPDLGVLLANLVSTGQVLTVRLPNLRQLLVTYPVVVAGGFTVAPGDGTAHFGLVLNAGNPPACTQGYGGTVRRPPSDTSPVAANRSAGCTAPSGSGIDVRGAQNAPGPSGTGNLPAAVTPPGDTSLGQGATVLTGYSAVDGRLYSGGSGPIAVVAPGGQQQVLGEESWTWLLLGPMSG